jgi:hypothetical protein
LGAPGWRRLRPEAGVVRPHEALKQVFGGARMAQATPRGGRRQAPRGTKTGLWGRQDGAGYAPRRASSGPRACFEAPNPEAKRDWRGGKFRLPERPKHRRAPSGRLLGTGDWGLGTGGWGLGTAPAIFCAYKGGNARKIFGRRPLRYHTTSDRVPTCACDFARRVRFVRFVAQLVRAFYPLVTVSTCAPASF